MRKNRSWWGDSSVPPCCQDQDAGTDGQGVPLQVEGSAPIWRWDALSKLVLLKLHVVESSNEVASKKGCPESPATQ